MPSALTFDIESEIVNKHFISQLRWLTNQMFDHIFKRKVERFVSNQ